jgi:hemerythrin-like metal-binding protein
LNSLVSYTRAHFASEERIMQQSGYPDIAVHKKEHEALAEKVVEFQRDFDAGRVGIGGGRHAVCTPKA